MRIDSFATNPFYLDEPEPEGEAQVEADSPPVASSTTTEAIASAVQSPSSAAPSHLSDRLLAEAHHAATDVAAWAGHAWSSVSSLWERAQAATSALEGEVGVSFPLGPTVVSLEASQDAKHGFSATAGLTALKAVKASVTVQDKDRDGKYELCGKVGLGSYKAEACLENPFQSE